MSDCKHDVEYAGSADHDVDANNADRCFRDLRILRYLQAGEFIEWSEPSSNLATSLRILTLTIAYFAD